MKKLRLFIISIIFLMITQISSQAAFWHKDNDLGNEIQKEEYPDSRDVEPKKESDDSLVIQVGADKGKVRDNEMGCFQGC